MDKHTFIYIYEEDYLHILLEAVGGWVWQHAKSFNDIIIFLIVLVFAVCICLLGCGQWGRGAIVVCTKKKNRPAMTHIKLV